MKRYAACAGAILGQANALPSCAICLPGLLLAPNALPCCHLQLFCGTLMTWPHHTAWSLPVWCTNAASREPQSCVGFCRHVPSQLFANLATNPDACVGWCRGLADAGCKRWRRQSRTTPPSPPPPHQVHSNVACRTILTDRHEVCKRCQYDCSCQLTDIPEQVLHWALP